MVTGQEPQTSNNNSEIGNFKIDLSGLSAEQQKKVEQFASEVKKEGPSPENDTVQSESQEVLVADSMQQSKSSQISSSPISEAGTKPKLTEEQMKEKINGVLAGGDFDPDELTNIINQ